MKDEFLKIGKRETDSLSLFGIGKGSFVLARISFNLPSAMFTFLPTSFLLIHHSIEVFIKAFLEYEKIIYPHGKQGHELINLLKKGTENSKMLAFFNTEILNRKDFKDLLNVLDQSYLKNKYSFPGYYISNATMVRDLLDEIIYIFIKYYCKLYFTKERLNERFLEQLRSIDVPEQLLSLMEYKQKQEFIFCVIPSDL